MEQYTIQTCSVCKHPKRNEIEAEIMSHTRTQRSIAKEFNVGETSLSNHKNKHMMGNVKDKLRQIVQKSIMDGLEPDNMSELIRLMDYVEKMESENYLDGKEKWSSAFNEKYQAFEHLILDSLYFTTISKPLRRGIIVTARHCFMNDAPHDTGKWVKDMMEVLEEISEDAEDV